MPEVKKAPANGREKRTPQDHMRSAERALRRAEAGLAGDVAVIVKRARLDIAAALLEQERAAL